MERKQVIYFQTSSSLDERAEHTVAEIEEACRKDVANYISCKIDDVARGGRYTINWEMPVVKTTLKAQTEDDSSWIEFIVTAYRMETDEEMAVRAAKEQERRERDEKKKAADAISKQKRKDKEAERMRDPDYRKFIELKNKFAK